MSEIESYRLSAGYCLIKSFRILERHPPFHFLAVNRHQFDRLNDIVAEPLVEVFLNAPQFLFRLLGEGTLQVFPHHLDAVSVHIVYQQIQYISKDIMHPKR